MFRLFFMGVFMLFNKKNSILLNIMNSNINGDVEIDVFVEIAKNSHIKYEYNHEKKTLICDRILHTPFNYFFNYGFVPETLSKDNDPIDVVILMDEELVPGCSIKCKIIGCLETEDDSGEDPKLIVCPSKKIDPTYNSMKDITDVPQHTLDRLTYFFSHYKDLENKRVVVGNFLNKAQAIAVFKSTLLPTYV
jgi:inorganic pyrophosphatase